MEGLASEGAYNRDAKKALNQAIVFLIKNLCFQFIGF